MKKTNLLKQSNEFYLRPSYLQRQLILKRMRQLRNLYNYIMLNINNYLKWCKNNTEYGTISTKIYELINKTEELENEISQKKILKAPKTEISQLEKELKNVNNVLDETYNNKLNFFKNSSEHGVVQFKMLSKRIRINVNPDKTPLTDDFTTMKTLDNPSRTLYINNNDYYIEVKDSFSKNSDGSYSMTIVLCHTRAISIDDTPSGDFTDKVWNKNAYRIAYIQEYTYESGRPKKVLCAYSFEILPIIDLKSTEYAGSFVISFINEKLYSLEKTEKFFSHKKNKYSKRTQKTPETFKSIGFTTNDLMYIIARPLSQSFKKFPKETRHNSMEELNVLSGAKKSALFEIIKNQKGTFFLKVRSAYGKYENIKIDTCVSNKTSRNTETDYDLLLLETAMKSKDSTISILHKGNHLKLKCTFETNSIPDKTYGENAQPHNLGNGAVGIDPNAHFIAVWADSSKTDRIYSWETVSEYAKRINRINERIVELQRLMDASKRGTNPNAFEKDGKIKRGFHSFVYSRRYMNLKSELSNCYEDLANIKKMFAIEIANEIASLGNVFYSEIPMGEEHKENIKGIRTNESGRILSNHKNARSIQKYSVSSVMDIIQDTVIKHGGTWKWIHNNSGATQHSPFADKKKLSLSDRIISYGGVDVQRDLKSAYTLAYPKILVPAKSNKKKYKDNIWMAEFDDELLMNNHSMFVQENEREMKRMKTLNVTDENIIDLEKFNFENLQES